MHALAREKRMAFYLKIAKEKGKEISKSTIFSVKLASFKICVIKINYLKIMRFCPFPLLVVATRQIVL